MNNFTVSIIAVCLNSDETIEDTIRGILSQRYKDIEYTIIDGGHRQAGRRHAGHLQVD